MIGMPDENHAKLRAFVDGLKLYVYKTYDNPQDIMSIIDTNEDPMDEYDRKKPKWQDFQDPDDPDEELARRECVDARKEWRKRRDQLITNQQKLCMLLWGHVPTYYERKSSWTQHTSGAMRPRMSCGCSGKSRAVPAESA